MRKICPVVLSALAAAALATARAENTSTDRYQSIVDRNPFGLKPPPEKPVQVDTPPPKPKTEFYLAGITTVGYPKQPKAYLVNKDNNKKGADKFYTLRLNERDGDLTLVDVDVKERKVKIQYQGDDIWLSMKENGVPASAAPQPPPGVPHIPGMVPPGQPGAGQPLPMGNPTASPGMSPAPNAQPNLYPSSSINRRIPRSGNMGAGFPAPAPAPPAVQQTDAPVDPAEQYLRMKVDEQMKRKMNIDTPPIPPLPL